MFKKKKVFQSTLWNPETFVNSIKTAEIFFFSPPPPPPLPLQKKKIKPKKREKKKNRMLFQEMKLRVKTSKLHPIIKTCRTEIDKRLSRIIRRIELKTD